MANLFSDPVISKVDYLSAQRTLRLNLQKQYNWPSHQAVEFIYDFIGRKFKMFADGAKVYNFTVAKQMAISRMATKQDILNYAARGEFERGHFYSFRNGLKCPPNVNPSIQNKLIPEDKYHHMMRNFCHDRILKCLIKRINMSKEIKGCELDFLKENQPSLYKLYRDEISFTVEERREISEPSQSMFS